MAEDQWIDVGDAKELAARPVQVVKVGKTSLALTCRDGEFGVISNACNHVGGPLGEGTLDGDYVVCPWHYWKFHRSTGEGEPGFEADRVPAHRVRVVEGRVQVETAASSRRSKAPHAPHPLARKVERADGPIRVLGISTTAMTAEHPRVSTSDLLLDVGLEHARSTGCETQRIALNTLAFRNCEGFYSKAARACTWPCSITLMDPDDRMDVVYEAVVHWADVVVVATPIRWGAASSLYYKMVERMNCIQNQETIARRHLLKNTVASFIVTGGQDNVQAVAGQMLGFFAEVGCQFPQFPYVAHSRGWTAEDMENNVRAVAGSEKLREGTRALVDRSVAMAELMVAGRVDANLVGGGRKAQRLDVDG